MAINDWRKIREEMRRLEDEIEERRKRATAAGRGRSHPQRVAMLDMLGTEVLTAAQVRDRLASSRDPGYVLYHLNVLVKTGLATCKGSGAGATYRSVASAL